MKVLVIDVGGSHVKILASGQTEERRVRSGPTMSAAQMVKDVRALARGWAFDAVSIGYPGAVRHGAPAAEPHNLGSGWVGFDYAGAFGCPVKIVNDAAMQALGSFDKDKGTLLFLGLGTGLGTTLVVDGKLVPMELAHLPYRDTTFEDHVGEQALRRDGRRKWRKRVADVVARLQAALLADDVVLGGGNVRLLKTLPPGCRAGTNANAFVGGFRLWPAAARVPRAPRKSPSKGIRE
ncbi:MAG: ROK family protein [Burkholderiaceae bacterium]|jgi:polyphosphate glucokinase|nr:ROK family protein [Burkholderiaceae bacterium]